MKTNASSKVRLCEAAVAGIVRPELQAVGRWIVEHQLQQIGYQRQRVHALKMRLGGEALFLEMLQVIAHAGSEQPASAGGRQPSAALDRCLAAKEFGDLLKYVLSVGMEIESKALQVLEAIRVWNEWSERRLIQDAVGGWQIISADADKGRRRYTRKTVQSWLNYMVAKSPHRETMFWLHAPNELCADSLFEALEDGGLFRSIDARRLSSSYNILGGHRDHFSTVDALALDVPGCQGLSFRRYDTDLVLPEHLVRVSLPRVVVFECSKINLKAIMFIMKPARATPLPPASPAKAPPAVSAAAITRLTDAIGEAATIDSFEPLEWTALGGLDLYLPPERDDDPEDLRFGLV